MMRFWSLSLLFFVACATQEKKPESHAPKEAKREEEDKREVDSKAMAGDMRPFVNTIGNNAYIGKNVNRSSALTYAERLSSQLKDAEPALLFAYISANRLGNGSFNNSFPPVKKMVDQLVKKGGIQRDVPPTVDMELALHAIQVGRLAFAEHLLDALVKSSNKKVKANALNLRGVVALKQDRLPEAVDLFRAALAEDGESVAARLNFGFLALRGGDHETARKLLGGMQNDWFVQSGLILVSRLEGNTEAVDRECQKVLGDKPTHKPTLFNCGLHLYQAKKDYRQAREYITKMIKLDGGPIEWNERATQIISRIDVEEMQAKQKKAPEAPAAKTENPPPAKHGGQP